MMLTMFHAREFQDKIDKMDIDSQVKQTMNAQVDDFLQKLLELADFEPGNR